MQIPEIPSNQDPEFYHALSALVESASIMRQVLLMTTAAGIDHKRLMTEHSETITNADMVIDAWRDHLGIVD